MFCLSINRFQTFLRGENVNRHCNIFLTLRVYMTGHIVKIKIINVENIIKISGCSINRINNFSMLVIRKTHNKVPIITKQKEPHNQESTISVNLNTYNFSTTAYCTSRCQNVYIFVKKKPQNFELQMFGMFNNLTQLIQISRFGPNYGMPN